MKHGSLFSGIGGFDLAAEWMGWENVFHCELNPFGHKVLKHYWPNAESFNDITKTDFTKFYGTIDVISGGFPCQPYSGAGKRLGKNDERHLWPEMCRAIREITPRYVVGENVRGLTNWNRGLVFDEVCSDLENLGYTVAPYLIPASGTNAPHQRQRIWFIAHQNASNTYGNRFNKCDHKHEIEANKTGLNALHDVNSNDGQGITTNPGIERLQGFEFNGAHDGSKRHRNDSHDSVTELHKIENWLGFPAQPPVCGGDDGLPTKLDGISFPKWRNESIKAYGNAVVPQVVYRIFKAIEASENLKPC
jgi:DNA (cytosine-5)-methyltransferase 1